MNLSEALADARCTFPNFPDEVFTLWLEDRVKQSGWPPEGIEWQGFLFGQSPEYWKSLQWSKLTLTVSPELMASKSFSLAMHIIEAGKGTKSILSAYIPNTADRFKSALSFVTENATTPGTPLLLLAQDGIEVIDGNHRIAALLAVQSHMPIGTPDLPFTAWLAKPSGCVASDA